MAKTTDQAAADQAAIDGAAEGADAVTAEDIAEVAAGAVRYVILHHGVGDWLAGAIVTAEKLTGIDVDRLLGLGAIAPHQE